MRRDLKIGMIGGAVLCLAGVVWFCAKEQVVSSPLAKIKLHQATASENKIKQSPPAGKPVVSKASHKEIRPPAPVPAPVSQPKQSGPVIHTVTRGQTLTEISEIYYDTSGGWKKIYEANKEKLPRGPDVIRVGMKLIIP